MSAVDVIRKLIVDVNAIELAGRNVELRAPALAAVESYRGAAIVRDDEVVWIVRVDPQIVKIAMRAGQVLPSLSAIRRTQCRRTHHINRVFVFRIDEEFDVVPGSLHQTVIVGDAAPLLTGIIRDE